MKTSLDTKLTAFSPAMISVFRVVLGLLFTMHATQKLMAWPSASGGGGPVPVGTWPYWWAGIIELVVGVLLIVGLATRAAAFVGAGEMAFAYFTAHMPKAFWPIENGGEAAVLFCFAFLALVFTGGGAYALDAVRGRA